MRGLANNKKLTSRKIIMMILSIFVILLFFMAIFTCIASFSKKIEMNKTNFESYFGLHRIKGTDCSLIIDIYPKKSFKCHYLKIEIDYLDNRYNLEIDENNKIDFINPHECGDDCSSCSIYTINNIEGYITIKD